MRLCTKAGRLPVLAFLALAPSLARAHDVTAGPLLIQHPWIRATPGGAQVAGGYLTVVNKGGAPDRLAGGSLEVATRFELHEMSMTGDVMTMRPLGSIEILAGRSITLEPASKHIMFTGHKHGLKKGQEVDGTLVFEHAGTVPVRFTVEGIGAKSPGDASSPAGNAMPGMTMD